ncbi:hypothetical protein F4781DRAFT_439792 [Annulohypoxylon bovei var. microspora]|nr:hypothetical protein F4781DRAFT_439792 [Annulohypoxylon bovei var. microspora]
MTQMFHKTRLMASKLDIHPVELAHIMALPRKERRSLIVAKYRENNKSAWKRLFVPSFSHPSHKTYSSSPAKLSMYERMCKKITLEVNRRRKAEKKLKKARATLYKTIGEAKAANIEKNLAILSSNGGTSSNPGLVWRELEFKQWLIREITMPVRRLSPSSPEVVTIQSKPADDWNLWCTLGDRGYSLKHRVLLNTTAGFFQGMKGLAPSEEPTTSEQSSSEEETQGTAQSEPTYSDDELKEINKPVTRLIEEYYMSQGRAKEARILKDQEENWRPQYFAARLNDVASQCCVEMVQYCDSIHTNAHGIKKVQRRRAQIINSWNSSRAAKGRSNFKGLSAGRPSPLRVSTSVDDLDAKGNKEPDVTDWDWGSGAKDIDWDAVDWS